MSNSKNTCRPEYVESTRKELFSDLKARTQVLTGTELHKLLYTLTPNSLWEPVNRPFCCLISGNQNFEETVVNFIVFPRERIEMLAVNSGVLSPIVFSRTEISALTEHGEDTRFSWKFFQSAIGIFLQRIRN